MSECFNIIYLAFELLESPEWTTVLLTANHIKQNSHKFYILKMTNLKLAEQILHFYHM